MQVIYRMIFQDESWIEYITRYFIVEEIILKFLD